MPSTFLCGVPFCPGRSALSRSGYETLVETLLAIAVFDARARRMCVFTKNNFQSIGPEDRRSILLLSGILKATYCSVTRDPGMACIGAQRYLLHVPPKTLLMFTWYMHVRITRFLSKCPILVMLEYALIAIECCF